MRRPRLISPCVANRYAGENERIAEFSFKDGGGGLIALRTLGDGTNIASLYRLEGCKASIEGALQIKREDVSTVRAAISAAFDALYQSQAEEEGAAVAEEERGALEGLRAALATLDALSPVVTA